jgi:hypothetical protein
VWGAKRRGDRSNQITNLMDAAQGWKTLFKETDSAVKGSVELGPNADVCKSCCRGVFLVPVRVGVQWCTMLPPFPEVFLVLVSCCTFICGAGNEQRLHKRNDRGRSQK